MQQTLDQGRLGGVAGTCLIVEDSQFDIERLKRIIRKYQTYMHIEVAMTLEAAREVLKKGPKTLILLDNNLPDGLGADFLLEMARDQKLANTPVILVTDWPSPFMWEKAASAGVRHILNKAEFDARYVRDVLINSKKAWLVN